MTPMKLLNEEYIAETKTVNEELNGKRTMYISGPFLQAVSRNRNGRVYPVPIIEREVNSFQSLIQSREAIGELNHPETGDINPDRAAILITELHMDDNLALGKAKVLSTPSGKILESLINDDVRMGVSSRGIGDVDKSNIVCENYKLITIDAVFRPSAEAAYTDAMYESVKYATQWVLNESTGLYIEKKISVEKSAEKFIKKVDKKGSKAVTEAFIEFLKSL